MADESAKDLLSTLTESRLPALPDSREPEPTEAPERTEVIESGRKPEDVVQAREQVPSETQPPEETVLPAAPKKAKGKAEAKTYEIDGKKYTLAELEASGMLEKQIQTARQFEPLQQKYFKKLEEEKATPPAKTEAPPAELPQITSEMVCRAYEPRAKEIVQDLISIKRLEEDLVGAYPTSINTFAAFHGYAFDKIAENEAKLNKAIERLEATISYLNANKATNEGQIVAGKYNRHLDDLVAKDGKLYAGLKSQEIRDGFTKFLVEEVRADQDQCTGEKAPGFLAKQWVAFNSQVIMDAAKNGTADKQKKADKRFVTGEGSGSRPGTPEETPPLLDRLIDNSGRIRVE